MILSVDLLVGQMDNEAVELMSIARFNARFGVDRHSPGFHIGFSLGAMYLGLEEDEGLTRELGDFNLLLGGTIGYQF